MRTISTPWLRLLGLGLLTSSAKTEVSRRLEADPELWAGAAPGQLSLDFGGRAPRSRNSDTSQSFDASAYEVRAISGPGSRTLVAEFLAHHHYLENPGFPGPKFGLFRRGGGELLGICTFGRIANPNWASHLFPSEVDDSAEIHSRVRESEYLELNRLALVPDSIEPLGTGAASFLIAECLSILDRRNRALWLARSLETLGRPISATGGELLAHAQLDNPRKGLGFIKSVVSFADPMVGHSGTIYQASGWRYGGSRKAEKATVGARSGLRLSRRRIQKARNPKERGHLTSALRLLWEGARGRIRTPDGSEMDLEWLHAIEGPGLERKIRAGLRARLDQSMCEEDHVADVDVNSLRKIRVPGKHQYFRFLGSDYWARRVALRCRATREQVRAEESAWRRRGWGPRPDLRHQLYPE